MDILVVEDDIDIGNLLEELLQDKYSVCRAYSGTEAILQFENRHFDLVLLDLMLPGLSGEEVLERIKGRAKVIVISAKAGKSDRISNLLNGANDFISKPFDNDELLARVEVQLRENVPVTAVEKRISLMGITINEEEMTADYYGSDLHLTKLEFGILRLLIMNPNRVFSKAQIFEQVWNYDSIGNEESVKVHISSIRNKLGKYTDKTIIATIWGIGFKFVKE